MPKLLALAQDLEAATKLGQMGLVDGFTAAEEGTEQFWRNVAGDGAVDKVCVCRGSSCNLSLPSNQLKSHSDVLQQSSLNLHSPNLNTLLLQ